MITSCFNRSRFPPSLTQTELPRRQALHGSRRSYMEKGTNKTSKIRLLRKALIYSMLRTPGMNGSFLKFVKSSSRTNVRRILTRLQLLLGR